MKPNWIITASVITLASLALGWWQTSKTAPEVVMSIGDSYEKIEQASSYKMTRAYSEGFWSTVVKEPTSLRFSDPEFGFVTPPAKFLAISGANKAADVVRMSPQEEALPLKETIAVVVDLEQQLERGGWKICVPDRRPAYKTNPQIAQELAHDKDRGVFWRAGDKYMLNYDTQLFSGDPTKGNDRYLITISLGGSPLPPCTTDEEDRKRWESYPQITFPKPPPRLVSDWLESLNVK
ncbi:MAG: hypothetical protein WBP46_18735 [Thiolinea sp.]